MDITQVREAIAAALPLDTYPTIPHLPRPPCAIVYPETIIYEQTFDATETATFVIQLLAASVKTDSGQMLLDSFISRDGDVSISAAINADNTLNGTVLSAAVVQLRNYGTIEVPPESGIRYYGAQLLVDILA